jgi:hypothetical protein
MDCDGQEVARGEKKDIVDRMLALSNQFDRRVKVKAWSITTLRIERAEYLDVDTSKG